MEKITTFLWNNCKRFSFQFLVTYFNKQIQLASSSLLTSVQEFPELWAESWAEV